MQANSVWNEMMKLPEDWVLVEDDIWATLSMDYRPTGLDTQSVFADPQFVDPANGDFRLAPSSPARKLRADGGPIGAESLYSGSCVLPTPPKDPFDFSSHPDTSP